MKSLQKFVLSLMEKCYLVIVSTPMESSAFRIFKVMNDRGLDLQATDIIKADVIGKISDVKEREEYSKKWEDIEELLDRKRFNNLFSYIRMIFIKQKQEKSLQDEFRDIVMKEHIKEK